MTQDPGLESAGADTDAKGVMGDVQLRHLPEFHAVAFTARGPLSELPDAYAHLRERAEGAGAYATGSTVCIFYEKGWARADMSRYSLCMPTSKNEAEAARAGLANTDDDDALDVREIPRTLVAGVFYRGPFHGVTDALDKVAAWIKERPYLPAGAPRVVYLAEPGVLKDGVVEVEIQQPVIPKPR